MFEVKALTVKLPDLPPDYKRIPEIKSVQPGIKAYLEQQGFEVHREARAFRISHLHYILNQRVDFLAFKRQEIHIVECKGSELRLSHIFPAMLQITLYMRLYKMLQVIPDPQLILDEEFNPRLVRKGWLQGILAVPAMALHDRRVGHALKEIYESLSKTNLLEPNIEIWSITPE